MAFLGPQFEAHALSGLAEFYVNHPGLTLLESSPECLDFQAGQTKLVFVLTQGDTRPAYRFALNLPQTAPGKGFSDPAGNRVDVTADSGPDTRLIGDDGWSFLLVPDDASVYWISASVAARIISETKVRDYPYYDYRWRHWRLFAA